tara:strand:+ start:367 stop:537 length:171 start_codon:yes stop_codon:yes gene_type:complete
MGNCFLKSKVPCLIQEQNCENLIFEEKIEYTPPKRFMTESMLITDANATNIITNLG